jgi:hypothetical protein
MINKRIYTFFILFLTSLLTFCTTMAQKSVAGIYQLRGVMETASGFKLNEDSTFEFYFSYGALDRYGSGIWQLNGNEIIFNSKAWPGKDFKLIKSTHQPGEAITVRISAKNTVLLRYVYFALYHDGKATDTRADSKGLAHFTKQPIDSLALQFEFCPERISMFTSLRPAHNYFEFEFEPWFVEVFFKDFKLAADDKQLKGKHPLLGDKEYIYEKE